MAIPKIIVQTHKNEAVCKEYRDTWINLHPDFEYRFMDDIACVNFFREKMPNLLSVYEKLPLAAQKADLFRYAYIYYHGGIYSDVDTLCLQPIGSYINLTIDHMVVGIEMTPSTYHGDIANYTKGYTSPYQILQWTFAASPKHPALAVMLDKIRFQSQHLTIEQMEILSKSDRFTLEMTGPILFTQVINDYLSNTRPGKITVLEQLAWGLFNINTNPVSLDVIHEKVKVQHLFHGT